MVTRLPPSEFTFGRWDAMTLSWETIRSTDNYIKALLDLNIIGYCDAADIEFRPSADDYAVMFEEDHYQSWCHIPKDVFDEYLEDLE